MKDKSSSFKVGILTLIALVILLFTILWVKGRAFSTAERIDVMFKDVNGMRPGSGVQMMGLRVGQVEEITPIIENETSYVRLRFVITEPNINIPKASMISIQQSGLIGEQFLEITPPKTRTIYVPMIGKGLIYNDDKVQMKLSGKYYDVGSVKNITILSAKTIPVEAQGQVKTTYAYKIDYVVNLPGLILPEFISGQAIKYNGKSKLRIEPLDKTAMPYPEQKSPYTIIEPMRIADFMDLQYKAAESLTETNQKINDLLSDEVINDLKESIVNINALTAQATTTMEKAEKLIDSSSQDLDAMMSMLDNFTKNFEKLSTSITSVIDDKEFKPMLYQTTDSFNKLSKNLNKIMDATDSKAFASDLNSIMKNVNEISISVNDMTKDKKLKAELFNTITNVNKAMNDISCALEIVNTLTPEKKKEVQAILSDTAVTVCNLKKFSEKLNKRFLLFRLMF